MTETVIVPIEVIESKIYLIRGQKVMLDRDLAELYGVLTKALNRQVKSNIDRFPKDFMFQLTDEEFSGILRCRNCTSSWGGRRYLPLAFTEQGVAMLSSVLKSQKAVYVNIMIMRAFVKLRRILSSHSELAAKLKELERKYDGQFKIVFDAINQILAEPDVTRVKGIGFNKR